MNPIIKQMWIDALRSGKYEQTVGYLRIVDQYCCLGVLCDLAIKTSGIGEWSGNGWISDKGSSLFEMATLPSEVVEWAELADRGSAVDLNGGTSLVTLNDKGCTFEYIADVIEQQL